MQTGEQQKSQPNQVSRPVIRCLLLQAEHAARSAGEPAKARRYARGLATLTGQRSRVAAGKPVNEDDIPPQVAVPKAPRVAAAAVPELPPALPESGWDFFRKA